MTSEIDIPAKCCYCLQQSSDYEQYFSDEQGVYERLIEDTFNIQMQISLQDSILKMICLKCVEDLRFAAKVKQKILDVQKTLLEQSDKLKKQDDSSLKLEIDSNEYIDSGYCDDGGLDTDSECNYKDNTESKTDRKNNAYVSNEVVIKLEPVEQNDLNKMLPRKPIRRKNVRKETSRNIKKPKTLKNSKCVEKDINEKTTDNGTTRKIQPKTMVADDLTYLKLNTLNLLLYSNACLFKSKRTKYSCYYCKQTFLDIRDLRTHSLSHSTDSWKIDLSRCQGLTYKTVDISNLTCKLCSILCPDLTRLQDHLTKEHNIIFHSTGNLLQPYKLEEGFNCVICNETFNTFCRLSIHMNTHSTRNVCEKCGVAYTNRVSLRNHINSMHKEKKCTKCSAVFQTSGERVKHLRTAHNSVQYKRYCMKCDLTCQYSYQLKKHMIEKHGAKQQLRRCEHCDKIYPSPNSLRTHIRAVHIGERNHPCGVCELRFFTSCDRKRHEKTHGDEKSFSCDLCDVKFRSKDSMRRHLRRQHANSKLSKVS